jgi:hypothetical protein
MDDLLEEYKSKIEPLLPMAKKAFGSRSNESPEHLASRQYTQLLTEYYAKGGSLVAMAGELGVVYAGLRRRVTTADLPVREARSRSRMDQPEVDAAVERIKSAKAQGVEEYHAQIAEEYDNGISLARVAAGLGISGSGPLYYAVNTSRLRGNDE